MIDEALFATIGVLASVGAVVFAICKFIDFIFDYQDLKYRIKRLEEAKK